MGRRQGGPSRTGGRGRISESICNRRATPTPPIFNATLRAAAGWLFFSVARSLRINLDILFAPPASLRAALRAGRALKTSHLTCVNVLTLRHTHHNLLPPPNHT